MAGKGIFTVVAGVAALFKQTFGDRSQGEIIQWFWNNATQNRISAMPANTANLLLFSPL